MTKKMPCNCKHEFQDREYGPGIRLFNPCGTPTTKWRCTVCGREEIEPSAPREQM